MANRLEMAKVSAILALHRQGWSNRRISRTLGVDRKTVADYLQVERAKRSKAPPGPAPTGEGSKRSKAPLGSERYRNEDEPANCEAEGPGRSICAAYRQIILDKLDQGLSAKRIHQDLVAERGFGGSYYSVRRYVRRLGASRRLPFRRMEVEPGEQAQVDFGTGAPITTADGRRRKCYVFRIVLSHSRKAYSEVVDRQTTENFIRALENAFLAFGGVPKTLVIDNLRAAVKKVDWFEPELNPKVCSFCQHYETTILPTKPYMPRHKGKVERGIGYVQENALRGKTFASLQAENDYLKHWEKTVADTRIHGTTRKHVGKLFQEVERQALLPLPSERFPFFHEGQRRVHRDGHVEVAKSYYSVPPEYLGRPVWVRWNSRIVRVFNHRLEQITMHARQEPGRFSTQDEHIATEKISGVERGAKWLLTRVSCIGPQATRWAEAVLAERGVQAVRVLQGLLSLTKKYNSQQLEHACDLAWRHRVYQLRVVRTLLKRNGARQETFSFLSEHPIIRPLSEYDQFVRQSIIQGGMKDA